MVSTSIISQVAGSYPLKWPGKRYTMDQAEGQTLLGIPTGYGTAFMLLQHQDTFGDSKPQAINAYWDDSKLIGMAIEIGSAASPS